MTELPPPLPPAVARRGSSLGGWAAAVVIIASVATGIVQAWTDKQIAAAQGQSADFLKMEIEARYLVGMNEVAKPFAGASGFSQRQWLSPIEKAATSDQELLRLAILEGEILGDAEARETLKRIGDRSPDVIEDRIALESVYQTGGGIDLTNEQEEKLRKRHGWVGRLAVVHRSPAGDPERRAVLSGAVRTFVGTFALGTIVVIGLLAGMVLGAWGMFRFWSGSGHWGFAERERLLTLDAGSVWLETFAVYIGVMVLGGGGISGVVGAAPAGADDVRGGGARVALAVGARVVAGRVPGWVRLDARAPVGARDGGRGHRICRRAADPRAGRRHHLSADGIDRR